MITLNQHVAVIEYPCGCEGRVNAYGMQVAQFTIILCDKHPVGSIQTQKLVDFAKSLDG